MQHFDEWCVVDFIEQIKFCFVNLKKWTLSYSIFVKKIALIGEKKKVINSTHSKRVIVFFISEKWKSFFVRSVTTEKWMKF